MITYHSNMADLLIICFLVFVFIGEPDLWDKGLTLAHSWADAAILEEISR